MSEKRWLVRAVIGVGVVGAAASIWGFASPMLESQTSTDDLVISEEPPAPPAPPAPESTPGDGVVLAAGEDDKISSLSVTDGPDVWRSMNESMWYLPMGTDLSTFPFAPSGSAYECTEDQVQWFRDRGALNFGDFRDRERILHNEADAGGALALTNVRFENEIVDSDLLVEVHCGIPLGIGDGVPLRIELQLDGSPGVFVGVDDSDLDAEPQPGDEIASINVSPGEAETVLLGVSTVVHDLGPGRTATGRVIADVVSPEEGQAVLLEELVLHGPPVKSSYLGAEYEGTLVLADQPYACDGKMWAGVPCTLSEAMAYLSSTP